MNGRMRILVVDDDRIMVKTICDILETEGYETEPAYSGEEALERVTSGAHDCVLMDVRMHGMNGVETMGRMKTASPDLRVILMSAYTTEAQIEVARKRGAYTVLTKPVDVRMVVDLLSMLGKKGSVMRISDRSQQPQEEKTCRQKRRY